jgi:hypothetical protein
MSGSVRLMLATLLSLGLLGLSAPAAEAHGWKRHRHVRVTHRHVRVRHVRVRRPVAYTRTGAMAYRHSCY